MEVIGDGGFLESGGRCHANSSCLHLGVELDGFGITEKVLEARQREYTAVSKILSAMKKAHPQQWHLQRIMRTAL